MFVCFFRPLFPPCVFINLLHFILGATDIPPILHVLQGQWKTVHVLTPTTWAFYSFSPLFLFLFLSGSTGSSGVLHFLQVTFDH